MEGYFQQSLDASALPTSNWEVIKVVVVCFLYSEFINTEKREDENKLMILNLKFVC